MIISEFHKIILNYYKRSMEQMGAMMFNKEEVNDLENVIIAEGESVEFSRHETEKSGRRYLIACSKNDQEERARRAEVMRDASRIVIL
jgi:predicted HicB family RNase H-like nuclease